MIRLVSTSFCNLSVLFFALAISIPTRAQEPMDFGETVAPLLEQHCLRCHNGVRREGDLSLETDKDVRELGYLVPGDVEGSYLFELIAPPPSGERPAMPKEGEPLSEEQVRIVRRWIEEGAHWPDGLRLQQRSKADSSWWSLQPLASVTPPMPPDAPAAWKVSPIDRFIYAALAEKGLHPRERADRRTLIRRVTYDVTGLPPTLDEIEAFVSDSAPDAWQRVVDRLLASPRYGEHWARHWFDVIRFGESRGFERNEIINNLWPFRDYVIGSLNNDKPFDELVREHLAGDVFGAGDPDREVGTAFLVAGPYDDVGNQDPKQAAQIRANTIDEMVRATSEAFLGLTIGCARCHDHKFDPLTQQDYYAMYATFAGVHHGERAVATEEQRREREARLAPLQAQRKEYDDRLKRIEKAIDEQAAQSAEQWQAEWHRPPVSRKETVEEFVPVKARYVRLVVEGGETNPTSRRGYHIDEFEVWSADQPPRNVALAANGATASGASRVAEDFMDAYSPSLTIDGRFGARWIATGDRLTITLSESEVISRVVFSSDRPGEAGSHPIASFVSEYRIEVSTDGQQWHEVASSHNRQPINDAHRRHRLRQLSMTDAQRSELAAVRRKLQELDRQINDVPALPSWWVGTFSTPPPCAVFIGGDPQRRGPEAVPASPEALQNVTQPYKLPADAPEGDRRLALARWIVAPDNPLTPRVLANRLWHYHFGTGIVDTPSDFGYMGGRPSHPELLDWLARQVHASDWRWKPIHRMILLSETYCQASSFDDDAAAIDANSRLLWRYPPRRLTAEEIRDSMLFVAGRLDRTMGGPGFRLYRYIQDNVATYIPRADAGADTFRRAVYHQNARSAHVDLLTDFDCPDPAFMAPRRVMTTTPLQALTLMNHSFTVAMAKSFSERVEREAGSQATDQVIRAFYLAYGRPPDDEELGAATDLLRRWGLPALARVLFNSNEFLFVP